jgi:hypothetical protein
VAQPAFDQEPDSPSPLVLKVTDKFEPGLQAAAVVKLTQKFHIPGAAVTAGSPKLSMGFNGVNPSSQYHPAPQV